MSTKSCLPLVPLVAHAHYYYTTSYVIPLMPHMGAILKSTFLEHRRPSTTMILEVVSTYTVI